MWTGPEWLLWLCFAGRLGEGEDGQGFPWHALLITVYPHSRWKEVRKIKPVEEQQVKRMNLNVPLELHNNFKSVTAAEGKNMTDVLLEFIQEYIAKHSSPKTKGRRK
jgi:ParG